jgi:hypothetical protein
MYFMRLRLLFIGLIFVSLVVRGQQGDAILPVSWQYDLDRRISPIELPPIDLSSVIEQDRVNDKDKSLPWRYGINRLVALNLTTDGIRTELPNGGVVWQLAVRSPGAINLSVNFSSFYLPRGAMLHFYNSDRSDVSRAHNQDSNLPLERFGSWIIEGDIIWIEYYQPPGISESPKLELGGLIHGYRMGQVQQLLDSRGMNDSGDCNYDVNCPVGADFDSKKDLVKKAVALLNLGNGYLCSAVLINNTQRDKTPYLLTGNHCLENSDPALWSMRFNWVSPAPDCGTEEPSVDLQTNFTMSGAQLRANNERSDFALVELYNPIPDTWDVAFAGWDRTDQSPDFSVGIHHPNGDIMKVCRDDDSPVTENALGTEVWLIKGASAGGGDGWELGTTESGSSGSPLFDPEGRVIGQLYAGLSFCEGTQTNGEYDVYGRFAVSWEGAGTPQTRLSDWLDPLGTGQSTADSMSNILSVPENQLTGELAVYPNPVASQLTVMNSRYPGLTFELYTLSGRMLLSGPAVSTMNVIDVEKYSEGVYFLRLTDPDSGSMLTKKIVVKR